MSSEVPVGFDVRSFLLTVNRTSHTHFYINMQFRLLGRGYTEKDIATIYEDFFH
jgi:hypothetical protein